MCIVTSSLCGSDIIHLADGRDGDRGAVPAPPHERRPEEVPVQDVPSGRQLQIYMSPVQ